MSEIAPHLDPLTEDDIISVCHLRDALEFVWQNTASLTASGNGSGERHCTSLVSNAAPQAAEYMFRISKLLSHSSSSDASALNLSQGSPFLSRLSRIFNKLRGNPSSFTDAVLIRDMTYAAFASIMPQAAVDRLMSSMTQVLLPELPPTVDIVGDSESDDDADEEQTPTPSPIVAHAGALVRDAASRRDAAVSSAEAASKSTAATAPNGPSSLHLLGLVTGSLSPLRQPPPPPDVTNVAHAHVAELLATAANSLPPATPPHQAASGETSNLVSSKLRKAGRGIRPHAGNASVVSALSDVLSRQRKPPVDSGPRGRGRGVSSPVMAGGRGARGITPSATGGGGGAPGAHQSSHSMQSASHPPPSAATIGSLCAGGGAAGRGREWERMVEEATDVVPDGSPLLGLHNLRVAGIEGLASVGLAESTAGNRSPRGGCCVCRMSMPPPTLFVAGAVWHATCCRCTICGQRLHGQFVVLEDDDDDDVLRIGERPAGVDGSLMIGADGTSAGARVSLDASSTVGAGSPSVTRGRGSRRAPRLAHAGCTPIYDPCVEVTGPACAGCGAHTPLATLKALGGNWHPRCFRCHLCGTAIAGGGHVTTVDGVRPVHPHCIVYENTVVELHPPCVSCGLVTAKDAATKATAAGVGVTAGAGPVAARAVGPRDAPGATRGRGLLRRDAASAALGSPGGGALSATSYSVHPTVRVEGHVFHPQCMACAACGGRVYCNPFVVDDGGALFHTTCLYPTVITPAAHPACAGCGVVWPAPAVRACDAVWHRACMRCGVCRSVIEDGEPFLEVGAGHVAGAGGGGAGGSLAQSGVDDGASPSPVVSRARGPGSAFAASTVTAVGGFDERRATSDAVAAAVALANRQLSLSLSPPHKPTGLRHLAGTSAANTVAIGAPPSVAGTVPPRTPAREARPPPMLVHEACARVQRLPAADLVCVRCGHSDPLPTISAGAHLFHAECFTCSRGSCGRHLAPAGGSDPYVSFALADVPGGSVAVAAGTSSPRQARFSTDAADGARSASSLPRRPPVECLLLPDIEGGLAPLLGRVVGPIPFCVDCVPTIRIRASAVCAKCGLAAGPAATSTLSDLPTIKVKGDLYHCECFTCIECDAPLRGEYVDAPRGPTHAACLKYTDIDPTTVPGAQPCNGCGKIHPAPTLRVIVPPVEPRSPGAASPTADAPGRGVAPPRHAPAPSYVFDTAAIDAFISNRGSRDTASPPLQGAAAQTAGGAVTRRSRSHTVGSLSAVARGASAPRELSPGSVVVCYYHPHCLRCEYCRREVDTGDFIVRAIATAVGAKSYRVAHRECASVDVVACVAPCAMCGASEPFPPVEFRGKRWHHDCLKCGTCQNPLCDDGSVLRVPEASADPADSVTEAQNERPDDTDDADGAIPDTSDRPTVTVGSGAHRMRVRYQYVNGRDIGDETDGVHHLRCVPRVDLLDRVKLEVACRLRAVVRQRLNHGNSAGVSAAEQTRRGEGYMRVAGLSADPVACARSSVSSDAIARPVNDLLSSQRREALVPAPTLSESPRGRGALASARGRPPFGTRSHSSGDFVHALRGRSASPSSRRALGAFGGSTASPNESPTHGRRRDDQDTSPAAATVAASVLRAFGADARGAVGHAMVPPTPRAADGPRRAFDTSAPPPMVSFREPSAAQPADADGGHGPTYAGWRPLHRCAASGDVVLFHKILGDIEETAAASSTSPAVAEAALTMLLDEPVEGHGDMTPMHLAARKGHMQMLAALLAAGATPSARDADGRTALHYVAQRGFVPAIEMLLQHIPVDTVDKRGRTPLHFAAHHSQAKAFAALLQAGADIAFPDRNGRTPVHAAAEGGCAPVVAIVLRNGDNGVLQLRDNSGQLPADVARAFGHHRVAATLRGK